MLIRKENINDHEKIYLLIKDAFEKVEHRDGNEQDLVNLLRKGEAFIPELSLVAELNGEIIGHIMFTKARIQNFTVLALAPLSVLPKYQRQGIGTSLIIEGHKIAATLGYSHSIVLGDSIYYQKIGYFPAKDLGIIPPFVVPSENFMVYKLIKNAPIIKGVLNYAKEFGIS